MVVIFGLGCHLSWLCHRYDFLVRILERTYFFSNFLNFILHLGLITTPHVLYVHMIYVYSLSLMFYLSHEYMAKRSHLSHYDLLCHRYDFLVRLVETDLLFFETFYILHLGLITTPHVLT